MIPPNGFDFSPKKDKESTKYLDENDGRELVPGREWLSFTQQHLRREQLYSTDKHLRKAWTDKELGRLWRLSRWWDEPVISVKTPALVSKLWGKMKWWDGTFSKNVEPIEDPKLGGTIVRPKIPRSVPELGLVIAAWRIGAATDADILDQLLGESHEGAWVYRDLQALTHRKASKEYADDPHLLELAEQCRRRVLEIELNRGEAPTVASTAARNLSSIEGVETLVRVLGALGKGKFSRSGVYNHRNPRSEVFSDLVQVSWPAPDDTAKRLRSLADAAGITEERLVETAVYAPQWAGLIEQALKWTGLEDAVWWIHAHTKDTQWEVGEDVRESWKASVAERTPLSGEDLLNGAVDVEWFGKSYKQLKGKRWEQLYEAAKYASSAGGHSRARLFADAMLGSVSKKDVVTRIKDKRHQDSVRALGLLPLPKGKACDKEVMGRYGVIQEFLRTRRQFGSQRQESEKRAGEIGLENLARTAGYRDPLRLQWAMETRSLADLKGGRITVEKDDTQVSLVIDELGCPEIEVVKAGKPLKSVPAKLKKDPKIKEITGRKTELRRQVSRIRQSLEQAMCRGDRLQASELKELSSHPLLAPMLEGVVLVNDKGAMGYPVGGGKALADHTGAKIAVGRELRIAHPHDLLKSELWHEWQRECFVRERIQPFKQVFRELYVLTETETEDGTISRRYAGHQVHPRQAMALLGGRGWVAAAEEGVRRTFHELDLSAWVEFMEPFYTPAEVEGLTLEGVRFTKRGEWKPLSLEDIPPRVFSEVMRDLDLVVSVAHRGGVDPEASASTIEMRTSLIRETMSALRIENVRIVRNHAKIAGERGEYSVHLGSAVCHKQPGGHLFIVPVHAQHRGRIFLPFVDDDPKTAEVISKILLLARDKEIQDPTILEQIR